MRVAAPSSFFYQGGKIMPTYAYKCKACGHQLEALQKITDEPLKECPQCHQQTLQRGPGGGIGLSFTGSGFYSTDYNSHSKEHSKEPPKSSDNKPAQCCPCGKNASTCSSS
jgi:putative FmdB family regulatory protein